MKFIERLKSLLRRPKAEEFVRVVVDENEVQCIRSDGRNDVVDWSDLRVVGVETNSGGPFIEDVYYYLEGTRYGFYVPMTAQGADELVRRLKTLPQFDNKSFAEAMCCTDNARFVCWRRAENEA
jgi:hypothetical protein